MQLTILRTPEIRKTTVIPVADARREERKREEGEEPRRSKRTRIELKPLPQTPPKTESETANNRATPKSKKRPPTVHAEDSYNTINLPVCILFIISYN